MNTNDIIIKCKQTLGIKGFDDDLLAALKLALKEICAELGLTKKAEVFFYGGAAELPTDCRFVAEVIQRGQAIEFKCVGDKVYADIYGAAVVEYVFSPEIGTDGEINITGLPFSLLHIGTITVFALTKGLSTAAVFNELYRRILAENRGKKEPPKPVVLNSELLRREKNTATRIFKDLAENKAMLVGRFDFDDLRNYANSWGVDICEEDEE